MFISGNPINQFYPLLLNRLDNKKELKFMNYKYLFGPVPSRRLGISLGIDLVPFKTCSLDCIYCEVGKTTILTDERKEYIPTDELISELDDFLGENPLLDFVTFSGAGEPTLNSGIGKIISHLKKNYPKYKIALITNGTLFNDKKVRNEILQSDLILPSLDAASQEVFEKINRPVKTIFIDEVIEGLSKLRSEFENKIWLEIFIIKNLNDTKDELQKLKNALEKVKPDLVQLNSLDRPGTEEWVESVPKKRMEEIAEFFHPFTVEIIAKYKKKNFESKQEAELEEKIIGTLQRRPCTIDDLSNSLGISSKEILRTVNELVKKNILIPQEKTRGVFYKVKT